MLSEGGLPKESDYDHQQAPTDPNTDTLTNRASRYSNSQNNDLLFSTSSGITLALFPLRSVRPVSTAVW